MQKELNEQAAKLNYEYGEMAAENAYKRQLAMYERSYQDQSYSAMRKQVEDAGLSVGLMYGGSGSGGGQGEMSGAPQGATGGAQAGKAPTAVERQMANMQLSQLALTMENLRKDVDTKETQQEKNLAEAEAARANAGLSTEKKITEAQTRGLLIDKFNAEIGNINAGTAEINARRELTNTENSLKKLELNIKDATKESVIQTAYYGAMKAHQEFLAAIENVEQMKVDTDIKQKTKDTVIATYKEKLYNLQIDTLVKRTEGLLNKQECEKVYQEAYRIYTMNKHWKLDTLLDVVQTNIDIGNLQLAQKKLVVDSIVQIISAFVAGKAFGAGIGSAKAPEIHGKGTILYGPDGKPASWQTW